MTKPLLGLALLPLACAALLSCSSSESSSSSSCTEASCPDGTCVDGVCVEDDATETPDGGADADASTGDDATPDVTPDSADDDPDTTDDVEDDTPTGPGDGALCGACEDDTDCGPDAPHCAELGDALYCTGYCNEALACDDGFVCETVTLATGEEQTGCVPEVGDCAGCVDLDADGYGYGDACVGPDCDDLSPRVNPGMTEACDEVDNDCDGLVDETFDLNGDTANCGACGVICVLEHAVATCSAGQCLVGSCETGFANCDGDPSTGCESGPDQLNSCGGCSDLDAPEGAVCGTCDSGTWACDGTDALTCAGDLGMAAQNACGGCTELTRERGSSCGPCGRGFWSCDGTDALYCHGAAAEGSSACGMALCCGPDETCAYDRCVPADACLSDDACLNDSYCDPDLGVCVPYGTGPRGDHNAECQREIVINRFAPELQCVWETPPEGDPYPAWNDVLTTPVVVDFDFDNNPAVIRPSVVFTSDDGTDGSSELPTGLIRVIDGQSCEHQYVLDMAWTSHSSPPAVGDLDGDGTPEIVAFWAGGGVIAFTYNRLSDSFEVLWTSHFADGSDWQRTGGGWGGPGIHDLDDDGVPEILRGATVFSHTGELIDDSLGYLAYGGYSLANMSFASDIDGDGAVEIVTGDGIWQWDAAASTWVTESYFTSPGPRGHIALADFGDYPVAGIAHATLPEIVIVSGGSVQIRDLSGAVLYGPVTLPAGGSGGPPTVGDFDADGRAEVATAGRGSFSVFDMDCVAGGGTGVCGSGRTDGILWTRTSQDFSSSVTGSSVFDFEADGRAEAIYADECFTRVYDGESGDVIFSQYRSSCTWHENPIVADVDGDFNSEIVVPSNTNCDGGSGLGRSCDGLEPGNIDPQFVGFHCEENADCVSGNCDAGYCRCVDDAGCCPGGCGDSGFVCAAPPAGTPGTGNTCRASHPRGYGGIRIYSDALDRWVNSRPVWNQHAYNVTHVEDDGTIPATSAVRVNWETAGLNNFRQNVQGELGALNAPDGTVRGDRPLDLYCDPIDGIRIPAMVCNRGTETMAAGVPVEYHVDAPDGDLLCVETTSRNLPSGECEEVSCAWPDVPVGGGGRDVYVIVDPGVECAEFNNVGLVPDLFCEG